MLGIIHRTVIGCGPKHFSEYFKFADGTRHPGGRENLRRHNKQLVSHRNGNYLEILGNSILGLVDVYNLLPGEIVEANTVSIFQRRLQVCLIDAAKQDQVNWRDVFSPRTALQRRRRS